VANLQFDARTVPPQEAFEVIPAGWYNIVLTESEMKENSKKDGAYLALVFTIIDGPHANRKLFDRLNLQNPNPTAVEIAYKTLSAICHATGVIQVQDSSQLHGIPLMGKVSVRAAGPGADGKHYDAQNELKGYKPVDKGGSTSVTVPPATPTPTWAAPTGQAPWGGQPAVPAAPQQAPVQPQVVPQQAPWSPPVQQPPAPVTAGAPWTPPQPTQTAPGAPWTPPPNGNGGAPWTPPGQGTAAPAAGAPAAPPWARPPGQ
jgi:hypothetical protein